MNQKPLHLLIVKGIEGNEILTQKFFTKKRKAERVRFEFEGGLIKALIVSYVPKEHAIVLFVEEAKQCETQS